MSCLVCYYSQLVKNRLTFPNVYRKFYYHISSIFCLSPLLPFYSTDSEAFLKKNRYNLVQKVKSVDEIVDQLNFGTEMMAKVRAEQLDQDKMRKVLDFTNSRSGRELLIRVLMNHCPDVMEELINS